MYLKESCTAHSEALKMAQIVLPLFGPFINTHSILKKKKKKRDLGKPKQT